MQRKLFEEQVNIFGNISGKNITMTMKDLSKMNYLEACIKESLRLYPSVPLIGRRAAEPIKIDGHQVYKGDTVAVPVFKLHRNTKVWDTPDEFIPERFLSESKK